MVAGTLAKAGYWMGDHLYPPNQGNPKGMFEARDINDLNERLLATVVPERPWIFGRWRSPNQPGKWQRWLARVPVGTQIPAVPALVKRIQEVIRKEPYCLKDPRFSYTLPVWRPLLKNTVFVCVFREPSSTAQSILRQIKSARHLRGLDITSTEALEVWSLMYRHILENYQSGGEWLFLHYDQIMTSEGLNQLEAHTGRV